MMAGCGERRVTYILPPHFGQGTRSATPCFFAMPGIRPTGSRVRSVHLRSQIVTVLVRGSRHMATNFRDQMRPTRIDRDDVEC
jgi:hypothetical protein